MNEPPQKLPGLEKIPTHYASSSGERLPTLCPLLTTFSPSLTKATRGKLEGNAKPALIRQASEFYHGICQYPFFLL
jgi:hypothetical protein